MFQKAMAVRKFIQENRIHLVHSHLFFANVLARLAAPKAIPVFNSLHVISSLDNYTKNRLSLYLEKATYRQRHHIIAVSREVLNDFNQWVRVKGEATVLYNFIDDRFFRQYQKKRIAASSLKLVAVGNLRYQKNYPYLMEAFRYMPDNVTLDVYGEGPLRTGLQAAIDRHRLKIRLLGSRADLDTILPQYDAFIMCSFFEGQPLSLLEAIACGLPAILSDIPVLREVTKQHAVYFDINDPADLVKKIKAVQKGEIELEKNAEAAFAIINSFARKETYLNRLQELYANKLAPEMANS